MKQSKKKIKIKLTNKKIQQNTQLHLAPMLHEKKSEKFTWIFSLIEHTFLTFIFVEVNSCVCEFMRMLLVLYIGTGETHGNSSPSV